MYVLLQSKTNRNLRTCYLKWAFFGRPEMRADRSYIHFLIIIVTISWCVLQVPTRNLKKKPSEKHSNSSLPHYTVLILCPCVIPRLCNFVLTESNRCKIPPSKWNCNLTLELCPASHCPSSLSRDSHSVPLQQRGSLPISWWPRPGCSIWEVDPTLVLCQLSRTAADFSGYTTCPHRYLCYFTLYSLQ